MGYSLEEQPTKADIYGIPIVGGRQRLSSLVTPFLKYVIPAVPPILVVFLFYQFSRTEGANLYTTLPPLMLFGVMATALSFWVGSRLYKVEREGPDLILSNYRKEIRVPLAEVVGVECFWFSSNKEITLHFGRPTEFGSRIIFAPRNDLSLAGYEHPLAEELRRLARDNRNDAQGRTSSGPIPIRATFLRRKLCRLPDHVPSHHRCHRTTGELFAVERGVTAPGRRLSWARRKMAAPPEV